MPKPIRGADIVARTLDAAGLRTVFTLSGNHIMSLFDAALDTRLRLIHVRHEAAAVHMADAWGRLNGQCGVALVSGGAGFTNAAAALCTARAAESPLVLLAGHAGLKELGRGAFQELRQAEMAAPVAKASWTAKSAARSGHEVAEAVRIARSGRPGPVHLSLPFDLLDEKLEDAPSLWPRRSAFAPEEQPLERRAADGDRRRRSPKAERPLVLVGPQLCHARRSPAARDARGGAGRSGHADGESARPQRCAARRLRRGAAPGRSHRAARQGARLHAALRRSARWSIPPAASSPSTRRRDMIERVAREKGQAAGLQRRRRCGRRRCRP